jgi:uroporphyrinogen decarboxylase
MTKIDRFQAALAGKATDRPPFTLWYHFGSQHYSPERTAQIHLEFFKEYDLDFLKLMNDYDYPMPDGAEVISTPEDLRKITQTDLAKGPMGSQLKAVKLIVKELQGKAYIFDTVFDAWTILWRNLTKEAMPTLMRDYPQDVENALKIINDNLIQYALSSLKQGSHGILLSVRASAEAVTLNQYERFMRPFNLSFLKGIHGKGEFHILHAHGEKLYFDRVLDYPVDILSWADLNGGPSIAEARRKTNLTLMAGIDHIKFPVLSVRAIREQARKAIEQAGNTRFILAPGCVVPPFSFPAAIRAVREAVAT